MNLYSNMQKIWNWRDTHQKYLSAREEIAREGGAILKEIRLSLGLTQEQLATLIERDVTYISKIETGKQQLSFEIIEKLCTIQKARGK